MSERGLEPISGDQALKTLEREGLAVFDPANKQGPEAGEVSLDAAKTGEIELDPAEAGSLADQDRAHDPVTQGLAADRRAKIDAALEQISKTGTGSTQEALRERYNLDNTGEGQTIQEIADNMPRRDGQPGRGVSREMIRQRLDMGLSALKRLMGRGHPLKDYKDGDLDRS